MAELPAGPWHESPDAWDTIVINGKEWPGIASVEIDRAQKWDTKKAQGSHGAEREFKGTDLANVKIELRLWTTEHFAAVEANGLLADIEPDPGKKKQDAVSIQHAVAAFRKVSAVTIDKVNGPKVSNGVGVITIDATEYRKPDTNNATGTASGRTVNTEAQGIEMQCQELATRWVQENNEYIAAMTAYNTAVANAGFLDLNNPFGDAAQASIRMNYAKEALDITTARMESLACRQRGTDPEYLEP